MGRDVLECSLDFAKLADPMKDVLTCEHGRMRFGGIDVAGMAETTPTPFFLFSETQIDRNIATLRDTFCKHHPRTRVFYASKACSNLWFLDRVRRSGIDIEVNSGGELWKARKAGFQPQQIGFNGNAKTRAEIAAALQPPIEAIIVDSVFELRRVADVAADLGVQARVALRVDLNVASETHPGLRTSRGAKAGIDVSEALAAFGLAAQLPNIELVGMHYHIGSQITRVAPYLEALDLALALLDRVETAHDIRLEHLNIGGGFAIPYYDRTAGEPDTYFAAPHTLDAYAAGIGKRLQNARPDLQLYLEPGRAVVAAGVGAHACGRVGARVEEGDHVADLRAGGQVAVLGAGVAGVHVAAVAQRPADAERPHGGLAAVVRDHGAVIPVVAGVFEDRVEAGVDHDPVRARDAAVRGLDQLRLLGLHAAHQDRRVAGDGASGFQVQLQIGARLLQALADARRT